MRDSGGEMINWLILVFLYLGIYIVLDALEGIYKAKTRREVMRHLVTIAAVIIVFVFRGTVRL